MKKRHKIFRVFLGALLLTVALILIIPSTKTPTPLSNPPDTKIKSLERESRNSVFIPTTTIGNSNVDLASWGLNAFNAPFENAPRVGSGNPAIVSIAAGADDKGYYVLTINGQVQAFNERYYGSIPTLSEGITATAIAVDRSTGGYWVLSSGGKVYNFDAPDLGGPQIPQGGWGQYPAAVYLATAANGDGYYVLTADGTVYPFNAPFYGSLKGKLSYGTTAPVVANAIAIDYKTKGYWIITSTDQIYAFNAPNIPTSDSYNGNTPVAAAGTPSGGLEILFANGKVQNFYADNFGSLTGMPEGATASSIAVDASTGGYWISEDYSPAEGYLNPLRGLSSLVPQEIDQGVDYCGFGPIYPIGYATILNVYASGWPDDVFIAYKLTSGPAQGYIIYVAENVTPYVTVGQNVTPSTVLGYLHDAGNCLETGWADPSDPHGFAAAHSEYNGSNSTAYGINFSRALEDLGARPGLIQDNGPPGTIAQNWPQI
jgi:hypothetical protein